MIFAVFSNPERTRARTNGDLEGRRTRTFSRFLRCIKNLSIRASFTTSPRPPATNPIVKTLSSSMKMQQAFGSLSLIPAKTWPWLMSLRRVWSVNGYQVQPSEYIAQFSLNSGRTVNQFQRCFAEPRGVLTMAGLVRSPLLVSNLWKVCRTGNPIFFRCFLDAWFELSVLRRATRACFLLAHSTSALLSFPSMPRPRYCSWILPPSNHALCEVWKLE